MIFHVAHGSGTPLSLKIIGNVPKPETAATNTIWIDTNLPINGWSVSPVEPEMIPGALWIRSGAQSPVSLNVLKKNVVMVYLLSASQCIDGEWVDKKGAIYQGNKWVDLYNGILYDSGDQYESVTGGWQVGFGTGSATLGDSKITMTTSGNDSNNIHVETKNKIDLTSYKTLNVKGKISNVSLGSGISNIRCRLGYSADKKVNLANVSTKLEQTYTKGGDVIMQYDISEASGEWYIIFGIGFYSARVDVEKIWME